MTTPSPAGRHLIAELERCSALPDEAGMRQLLTRAAEAGKSTLLSVHLHHFGESGGVAGVALLAESHISVHTWPEYGYAAVDVFMCGKDAAPDRALEVLIEGLGAAHVRRTALSRNPTGG